MKIVRLEAENFRRLRAVEITPTGALVQISGANASGKTSVLDSIFAALGGKKAAGAVPVRQGEESALVKLDLGEVIVTRRIAKDGSTSLTVESREGARFPSPQAVIDSLMGALAFDPLAFSRMAPAERTATLRKLVPLALDVDTLDRLNAGDYEKRRDVNRTAAQLKPRVEALKARIPETMPARVDVSALVKELESAGDKNTDAAHMANGYADEDARLAAMHEEFKRIDAELARLNKERAELVSEISEAQRKVDARPPVPEAIDTTELVEKIQRAQEQNRAADDAERARTEYSQLEQELAAAEEEAAQLTERMADRVREKRTAIAAAQMPIPGLSFSDDFAVTFNGLPFENASAAEQLRTSVAIAMAMNPKLRVLLVRDGSLLDESNLAAIAAMAEAGDYQLWVERVDTSGRVGFVMEDGQLKQPEK